MERVCRDLGPHTYWFLYRKGVVEKDIIKVMKGSFTIEEQKKTSRSSWSKTRGRPVVKRSGEKNILTVTEGNSKYDLNRGLTDKEKQARMARYGLEAAQDMIKFGEAKPGDVEAFNFNANLSVNTLSGHHRVGAGSVKSGKTLKNRSVFSAGDSTIDDEEESY